MSYRVALKPRVWSSLYSALARVISTAALLWTGVASATTALGNASGFQFYLDESSLSVNGSVVTFKVYGVSIAAYAMKFAAHTGVDCEKRTRIDYYLESVFSNGHRQRTVADSQDMRSVYDDTRQAFELEKVCELAGLPVRKTWTGLPDGTTSKTSAAAPAPTPVPAPIPAPVAAPAIKPAEPKLKATGSGFVVASNGIVATNVHVIEDCRELRVRIGERWMGANVLAFNEESDLALLQLVGGTNLTVLPLNPAQAQLGSPVTVLGYPLTNVLGSGLRVTTGVVSSVGGIRGDKRELQVSAPMQAGNSGGPVLNESGSVIGVAVARLSEKFKAENVNFAVKAALLRALMDINGIEPQIASSSKPLSVAEVVKRASSSTALVACF